MSSHAGHSGTNAVNQFDKDAWSNVFDVMTQAREEEEDAGAVSARQAGDMVRTMLTDMQTKYTAKINDMEEELDVFKAGVAEIDEKVTAIDRQINDTSAWLLGDPAEGVPKKKPAAAKKHTNPAAGGKR